MHYRAVITVGEIHTKADSHVEWKIRVHFLYFVSVLPACMCTTFVPCSHRGQKKVLDPVELELRMDAIHHVESSARAL